MKGESLNTESGIGDFYYRQFNWVDGKDSGECFDRFEEMRDKGTSYPMESDWYRDGLYDPDTLFLLYDTNDLGNMVALFGAGMALSEIRRTKNEAKND